MTNRDKIRWGILGPGRIAGDFFAGVTQSRTGRVDAIATREPNRPGLAERFPGTRIIKGYEALLADPNIDAIYISTPHPTHAEWAIKAARAGKNVLCEKPIGLSAAEAEAMLVAAHAAGTFLGEAYMYRHHPLTLKLIELLKEKAIGDVRMIKSSFGFAKPFDKAHRLFANDLAGGGILDIGGYPVSMARLIAGIDGANGVLEPDQVFAVGHLGPTGVDEWSAAVLRFPNGIIAEVACSISLAQDNVLRIFGTAGSIEIDHFWFAAGKQGGAAVIRLCDAAGTRTDIAVDEPRHVYSFEVDAVADAMRAGKKEFAYPGMTAADTIGNLKVMDKWRAGIGLEYALETPAVRTKTLAGETLRRGEQIVPRGHIPGIEKEVSMLALGMMLFSTFPAASIALDEFFEAGGNLVDSAFQYGGGTQDRLIGEWVRSRGVRDDVVIIEKGAHSPLCYPDVIAKQLATSLERMQTDYVDIYFMHRDNPDIPVGEFVDAMDAEVQAGRIRGPIGGSNWTRERMDQAIEYAERTGKTRPSVLSNNFSLAEMIDPVWPGCIASSDTSWKQWLKDRKVINFAWSSQARGFFTDRSGPDKIEDRELVRAWYSDLNFQRKARAEELGRRLNKDPIQIALAYVLNQPWPVVPLIGPASLAELRHSLIAASIALSPDEVQWLEIG